MRGRTRQNHDDFVLYRCSPSRYFFPWKGKFTSAPSPVELSSSTAWLKVANSDSVASSVQSVLTATGSSLGWKIMWPTVMELRHFLPPPAPSSYSQKYTCHVPDECESASTSSNKPRQSLGSIYWSKFYLSIWPEMFCLLPHSLTGWSPIFPLFG